MNDLPFFGCAREYLEIMEDALFEVRSVLASGNMLQSEHVRTFEERIAVLAGRSEVVAVGSATDGLAFALMALGIGPGDSVLVTNLSFVASATSILRVGAQPIFVDIGPEWSMDLRDAVQRLKPCARAMISVDLFGAMRDPEPLEAFAEKHGLALIEDASQSLGAGFGARRAGGTGAVSVFSFDPTKVLGAPGSGGAVLTDNPSIASRVRELRYHGVHRGIANSTGYNSQLASLAAALLLLKLDHVDDWRARRAAVAARYRTTLDGMGIAGPEVAASCHHAWHKFVVSTLERDRLRAHLGFHGIPTRLHYERPLHWHPVFAGCTAPGAAFPAAEAAAATTLSLPIHAHLEEREIVRIDAALTAFVP